MLHMRKRRFRGSFTWAFCAVSGPYPPQPCLRRAHPRGQHLSHGCWGRGRARASPAQHLAPAMDDRAGSGVSSRAEPPEVLGHAPSIDKCPLGPQLQSWRWDQLKGTGSRAKAISVASSCTESGISTRTGINLRTRANSRTSSSMVA